MKILVTGINGFVGRNLYPELIKAGHDVVGIDIHSNRDDVIPVDITNPEALRQCVSGVSPDLILHLAAVSAVDYKIPQELFDINAGGTLNLLAAAIALKVKPNFIMISSPHVYGNVPVADQPIRETQPINPINLYGATKAGSEMMGLAFMREYGLPVTILRPFNHIGRGQNPRFVVPKIVAAFTGRQEKIELGNTGVQREFIDVRDVVDAYLKAVRNFIPGEVFNISCGKGYTIDEIIVLMRKITGHEISVRKSTEFIRKSEIESLIGDGSKFRQEYRWSPRYDMEDTLRWMISEQEL